MNRLFNPLSDEAIEQCWKSNDLFPNSFWPSFFGALAYEQKGRLAEVIHAGLGDDDQAFEWLDRAYQEHSSWMAYLKVKPRLDALRSHSRFAALLKRVALN